MTKHVMFTCVTSLTETLDTDQLVTYLLDNRTLLIAVNKNASPSCPIICDSPCLSP